MVEFLFMIFDEPVNRHIYFLMASIFVSEPRKIHSNDKTRDKFRKLLKPIFFD